MVEGNGLENRHTSNPLYREFESLPVCFNLVFSNGQHFSEVLALLGGQVSERFKEHDWNSCGCNSLVGSNPTLSGNGSEKLGAIIKTPDFNFQFLVALSGEIAVPCICNPLSRAEFSGLGPRLWGRPKHGALISGPRATSNCESRQGRKAATVSKFWRAPRESCFEPPTAVPPGSAFVKARVRDHFSFIQSKPQSNWIAAFLFLINAANIFA